MAVNIDYEKRIKDLIAAGGRAEDVQRELNTRVAKATSTPGLEKYAYDDTYNLANNYIKANTPTVPQVDITGKINDLKNAQIGQTTARLDHQRNMALSNLQGEKANIAPQYYDKRNQANATYNQGNRSFAEFLAQRGLNSSGVAAQGAMNNMNAYQGNIGSLNRQEQAANNDIARRSTDVQNNYLSDLEAARQGIEANALQQMISQMNADRTYNRDVLESDRGYNYQVGRDQIGDQRYQQEYQDSRNDVEFQRKAQTIENEMRQIELDAMRNPNSPENQMKALQIQELRKQIAEIGRQPAVSAYEQEMQNIKLEQARIQLDQLKNPQAQPIGANDYKTNPDYADDVAYINANPNTALKEIQHNAQALIQKYGYDGYMDLVKLATPPKE